MLATSLGAVAVVTAEAVARIDDWIRLGIPLAHTPDYDHDLRYRDWFGIRGRPNGKYRQWRLNNFGFRGPDMARVAPAGCRRVMILGASETFGLYESDNREYPAQLRDSLRTQGCYEVVNAAIAGAGLQAIIRLWEHYLRQFQPDVVLVYASPAFYLGANEPRWTLAPGRPEPETDLPPRPRLIEQFQNAWQTPEPIQRRRVHRWIAQDTSGKPEEWFFRAPPADRLDAFMRDLDSLVKAVSVTGARPMLITHAMRFSMPPDPKDEVMLLSWRHATPRATSDALLGFEAAAAERMREYAERNRIPIVDAQRVLSGRRAYFGDQIHFTDEGAGVMAGLIARRLRAQRPSVSD